MKKSFIRKRPQVAAQVGDDAVGLRGGVEILGNVRLGCLLDHEQAVGLRIPD